MAKTKWKIGLVSDTHGLFEPKLESLFDGVDLILHAGDIVGDEVLEKLGALAQVRAVAGNNDEGSDLPAARVEMVGACPVLIVHDVGPLDSPHLSVRFLLEAEKPRIVVSGHSHKGRLDVVDGVLFINPGSAGKKRFSLIRSAAVLTIDGDQAHATLYSLEAPKLKQLADVKHRLVLEPRVR